jgi:hypothetical protein
MLKIARSPAPRPNSVLKEVRRKPSEDNTAYVAAHASSAKQASHIVLLGGVGPLDFRLRAAQAHVRDDLAPSAWSHVLLLGAPAKDPAKTVAYEIALYGRAGVGFPPATNGVAKTTLGEYRDPSRICRSDGNHRALQAPAFDGRCARTSARLVELRLGRRAHAQSFARQSGDTGGHLCGVCVRGCGLRLSPGFSESIQLPRSDLAVRSLVVFDASHHG